MLKGKVAIVTGGTRGIGLRLYVNIFLMVQRLYYLVQGRKQLITHLINLRKRTSHGKQKACALSLQMQKKLRKL